MNQKQIDVKIKLLSQNTTVFVKQTQQWMQILDNFNNALKVNLQNHLLFHLFKLYLNLKELGDVENWSKKIETDMKIISTTLNSTVKSKYIINNIILNN